MTEATGAVMRLGQALVGRYVVKRFQKGRTSTYENWVGRIQSVERCGTTALCWRLQRADWPGRQGPNICYRSVSCSNVVSRESELRPLCSADCIRIVYGDPDASEEVWGDEARRP